MLDLARVVLLATLSVAGASAAWAQPARGAAADGVRADAGSASISATDPTLAWTALSERAKALEAALPPAQRTAGPWPRDAALERMKAQLAQGLPGPAPTPLPDWAALKRLAADNDPALASAAARDRAAFSRDEALFARSTRAIDAGSRLYATLGLSFAGDTDRTGEQALQLVRQLELPSVRASWFKSEAEIAPPSEDAMALAGRFGSAYRTFVTQRKPARAGRAPVADHLAGLYDMRARTTLLARPVQTVQLMRDGGIVSRPTLRRKTALLWEAVEEPECIGWAPGFTFGDVKGPIWDYFKQPGNEGARIPKATGRLFSYQALRAPPLAKAAVRQQVVALDRAATGFVRFTQLSYDVDGDGVPDLVVLEGVGHGPGHLEGPTTTDDPWYRLALVNVAGAWKVLEVDQFQYGCGC